jgi:hypothetical protein
MSSGIRRAGERAKPMEEARDATFSRECIAADSSMEKGLAVEPTPPCRACLGKPSQGGLGNGIPVFGCGEELQGSDVTHDLGRAGESRSARLPHPGSGWSLRAASRKGTKSHRKHSRRPALRKRSARERGSVSQQQCGFTGSNGEASGSRDTGMSRGIEARHVAARGSAEAFERTCRHVLRPQTPHCERGAHWVRCGDLALPGVRELRFRSMGKPMHLGAEGPIGGARGTTDHHSLGQGRAKGQPPGSPSESASGSGIAKQGPTGMWEAAERVISRERGGRVRKPWSCWNAARGESSCTRGSLRGASGNGKWCSGCRRRKCLRWPG